MADQPFAPDIAAIERSGHRRVRRGFALRAMAGLGAVSVAMAGGLVAAGHTGGPSVAAGKATTSGGTGTAKAVAPHTWTPRSAAMDKLVNQPVIPAGYTQVSVSS